ncbi:hypothetical protein BKM31_32630 [[Actinomadura] parvosata subsp. kistnae]|uniref:Uncharacterized protein n=1 Tax=[Actinomadura] parvosata subsp. kistnae TaxID=1909395 RepID=A0A1V0A5U7_9ACTN|nr:hypothetical protein BKM31_32630 [Nonomuraea sp. ATCC 55076]
MHVQLADRCRQQTGERRLVRLLTRREDRTRPLRRDDADRPHGHVGRVHQGRVEQDFAQPRRHDPATLERHRGRRAAEQIGG